MNSADDKAQFRGGAPSESSQPIRFAGSVLGAQRHVCAFFHSPDEEYRVLLPFIKEGFESGEKAFHIVDPKLREHHLQRLASAGIDVAGAEKNAGTLGPWYREIGQGMGAALNTASSMNGYVLADRGTWLSFKNRGEIEIVVEDDKRLFNQYGVILVNPAKHAHVKAALGQQFIDWLVSAEGQKAIADYKINGEQLFFANATVPGA